MSIPKITTRAEWNAEHGTGTPDPGAEPRVVIHHSYRPALAPTATVEQEVAAVQSIERYHAVNQGWAGIGYNFLAAPSGRIYEGRGWKYRGAHAGPVNGSSIGICLLINGNEDEPTPEMMTAVRRLIGFGVELGEITEDYTITGHRDHMPRECPGDLVYARLDEFRHLHLPDLPMPEVALVGAEWTPEPLEALTPVRAIRSPVRAMSAATAKQDETVADWLCRISGWALDDPELTARLPWWIPAPILRRGLEHVFGCR